MEKPTTQQATTEEILLGSTEEEMTEEPAEKRPTENPRQKASETTETPTKRNSTAAIPKTKKTKKPDVPPKSTVITKKPDYPTKLPALGTPRIPESVDRKEAGKSTTEKPQNIENARPRATSTVDIKPGKLDYCTLVSGNKQ